MMGMPKMVQLWAVIHDDGKVDVCGTPELDDSDLKKVIEMLNRVKRHRTTPKNRGRRENGRMSKMRCLAETLR